MPRVPVYNEQTVAARGVPQVRQSQQNLTTPNGLGALGKGISDLGNGIQQQQDYSDELRAEESVNRGREYQLDRTLGQESGYTNIRGKNALGIVKDYETDFDSHLQGLREGLGNDRQKMIFDRYASRMKQEFKGGLMRHSNGEADSWRKQTVQGVLATEADSAAKNWNNPEAIDLSRGRIDLNLSKMRDAEGLPAEEVQRLRTQALTKLHAGVIDNLISNRQTDAAKAYLAKYRDEIDPGIWLRADENVRKESNTVTAFQEAQRAISPAAESLEPGEFGRLINLVAGRESGGRERDADGNLITSPKGAQGKMQVMPGTNKDPGFGVTPAQDDSDAERTRVGRDYLQAMIKRYGDLPKALAAYNAGPGAVDDAVKNAKGGDWMASLPKETRDYVPAILSKYQSGGGAPKRESWSDVETRLRDRFKGNPDGYKTAVGFAKPMFEAQEQAVKQKQTDAEGDVYRTLMENGGEWINVPTAMRNAMDPTKVDTAMAFAKKLKGGENRATDWGAYYQLRSDPALLAKTNLHALLPRLGEAEFKELVGKQQDLKQGKADTETHLRTTKDVVDSLFFQSTGIKAPKSQEDDARKGKFMSQLEQTVQATERATGRKLKPDEVEKEAARLLTKLHKPGRIWGQNEGSMLFEANQVELENVVVPDSERTAIESALKARQLPVTEAAVLSLYKKSLRLQ